MPKYEITTESGKKYEITTDTQAAPSQPIRKTSALQKTAKVGEFLGMKPVGDILARGAGSVGVLSALLQGDKETAARRQQTVEQIDDPTARQVAGSVLSTALLATPGSALKAPLQGAARAGTRLAGRSILGAGLGGTSAGAISTAQGKNTKEAASAALGGALIGGLIPVAAEGAKSLAKGASKLSGLLTQQGGKQTQLMFERGATGQAKSLKQFSKQNPSDVARSARHAVDAITQARNKLYQRDMAGVDAGQVLDINPIKQELKNTLVNNYRAKFTKDGLNLAQSRVATTSQPRIEAGYKLINEWDDFSVSGVDALKQQLGEMAFDAPLGSKAKAFLTEASKKLTSYLDDNVQGYRDVTSKYAETTKAIKFAEEVLNLRKKKATGDINLSTVMNKIGNVMKDNNAREIQFEALKDLSQRSGVDLVGMVLAQNARRTLPQGFLGQGLLVASGGATATPGGLPLIPSLLATLAGTSPRVASNLALRGGQLTGLLQKSGVGKANILPRLLGGISANQ